MLIREATPPDAPAILGLVRELAEYERSLDEVVATLDDVNASLFGPAAVPRCHVAELDGEIVGLSIWFFNYSTWLAQPGIYLEDLYVRPAFRGLGIGTALMRELAALCVERGYRRFQWSVLDWNQPSIDFYQSIGAIPMGEWTVFRLHGEALRSFAEGSS